MDLYDKFELSGQSEGSRERNAVLFMIFAIAKRSYPATSSHGASDNRLVLKVNFDPLAKLIAILLLVYGIFKPQKGS